MTHVRSHANSQQKSRHKKDTLYHSTDTKFDSRENPMTASRRDPAGRGRGGPPVLEGAGPPSQWKAGVPGCIHM